VINRSERILPSLALSHRSDPGVSINRSVNEKQRSLILDQKVMVDDPTA